MNQDSGSLNSQLNMYKQRIQQLEDELQSVHEAKTSLTFDIRRVTTEKEKIEKSFKDLQ
jgi:predicted  nucleic acid-binding Zn-ribbon protein